MTDQLAGLDGKYQILAKIREGGMGAIYKVRHRLLDEERVIKVMRPQLEGDAAFAERFQREARAASRLRHPNIAQIYDFSIGVDGSAYIVMEYIDGVDLRALLDKEQLPPVGLVIDIAAQALTALGFLHQKQFVHRDISPDNLMVTSGPQGEFLVKLIDLGIAKSLDSGQAVTLKGEFLGKFRYASPEHFGGLSGEMTVEPRSDLYSFGIVLYQLLTGTVPFVGKDFSTITASHLYRPPIPFEQTDSSERLPGGLRQIVLRSLEKDPADRFPSAEAMRDALLALDLGFDPAGLNVEQTLMMARTRRQVEEGSDPGSTQERLNRQFPDQTTADTSVPTALAPNRATRPLSGAEGRAPGQTFAEAETAQALSSQVTNPGSQTTSRVHLLLAALVAILIVVAGFLSWRLAQRPSRPDLSTESTPAEVTEPATITSPAGVDPQEPSEEPTESSTLAASFLADMRAARDELLSLETTNPGATDLAEAWRKFLASYSEELPDTEEDDRIRELARQRQGYWQGRSAAAEEMRSRQAQNQQAATTSPRGEGTSAPGPTRQGDKAPSASRRETPRSRPQAEGRLDPERARAQLAARGITPSTAALQRALDTGDGRTAMMLILADPSIVPSAKPGQKLVHAALERGRLDLAALLIKGGARPDDDFITDAASRGDLAVVQFLGQRRMGDLPEALEDAFDSDEWQVGRYLISIGVPMSGAKSEASDMLIDLAEDGDRDGVRWLIEVDPGFPPKLWRRAAEEAADNGHHELAEMIRRAKL